MKVYTTEEYIKEGDSIGMFYDRMPRSEKEHRHDFIEIIYVLSGTATEKVDDKVYEVKHGDMLFINYGSIHAFVPHENFRFINICFSPETLGNSIITQENAFSLLSLTAFDEMRGEKNFGLISFFGNERKNIEDILSAMLQEHSDGLRLSNKIIESYMNILITKMLRKTEPSIRQQEINGIWSELSDYIDQNLDSELTLSALASKCFYNPSYFSRMFKQKFQMSLTEYVSRKRVDCAISLLKTTDLSIDEIWARSGFADRSTFYHTFSKYTDATPAEYRGGK